MLGLSGLCSIKTLALALEDLEMNEDIGSSRHVTFVVSITGMSEENSSLFPDDFSEESCSLVLDRISAAAFAITIKLSEARLLLPVGVKFSKLFLSGVIISDLFSLISFKSGF